MIGGLIITKLVTTKLQLDYNYLVADPSVNWKYVYIDINTITEIRLNKEIDGIQIVTSYDTYSFSYEVIQTINNLVPTDNMHLLDIILDMIGWKPLI